MEATSLLSRPVEVCVIGGGIAGTSTAYYLSRAGISVTLLERNGEVGSECSYGPPAALVWFGVEWLDIFSPANLTGPLLPDLSQTRCCDNLRFLCGFARGALSRRVGALQAHGGDMMKSREIFFDFLKENPDFVSQDGKPICNQDGVIYLLTESGYNKNRQEFNNNPNYKFLTRKEFEADASLFEPDLLGDVPDGYYHGICWAKGEGYLDPSRCNRYIARKLTEAGNRVCTNADVTDVKETETGVTVQYTVEGQVKTENFHAVVVAAGADANALLEGGVTLASGRKAAAASSIMGIKGYTVTGEFPKIRRVIADGVALMFVRPFVDKNGKQCVRCVTGADPVDPADPKNISWARIQDLFANHPLGKPMFQYTERKYGVSFDEKAFAAGAASFDTDYDIEVEDGKLEVWCGLRPYNTHGNQPVIGKAQGAERVWNVNGFGFLGYNWCWLAGSSAAAAIHDDLCS